jgi:predicted ribosomally synthesized peptide with SipW-like signal peptide
MNRKLVMGAVAGVAAIGLAVGGTTYAAWSDFGDVTGNHVGAGILKLNLGANNGSDLKFDHVTMAPGGINLERNVYVASNDGASTPDAQLFMSLKNIAGTENGCDSNGERTDDANCSDTSTANQGQFVDDAIVQATSYTVNSPNDCTQAYAPAGHAVTALHGGSLNFWKTQVPWQLTGDLSASGGAAMPVLAPGQGLCVSLSISLAHAVDNASQGDSAAFDIHFDLVQP